MCLYTSCSHRRARSLCEGAGLVNSMQCVELVSTATANVAAASPQQATASSKMKSTQSMQHHGAVASVEVRRIP